MSCNPPWISPNGVNAGGHFIPGVDWGAGHPIDWAEVEPGWGQAPGLLTIEWGGEGHEYDVRITKAPVVVQRFDHPDRPRPRNHGGHNQ